MATRSGPGPESARLETWRVTGTEDGAALAPQQGGCLRAGGVNRLVRRCPQVQVCVCVSACIHVHVSMHVCLSVCVVSLEAWDALVPACVGQQCAAPLRDTAQQPSVLQPVPDGHSLLVWRKGWRSWLRGPRSVYFWAPHVALILWYSEGVCLVFFCVLPVRLLFRDYLRVGFKKFVHSLLKA